MNPEFQRNLWLEASPRRLAWAGVVLLLIYGATVMATRTNPYGPLPVLGGVGAAVFVACAMIWASRAAATSILPVVPTRGPSASAVLIGEVVARAIRSGG